MSSSLISRPSRRVQHLGQAVWQEFTPLSIENNSINLGQGFPGFECPDFLMDLCVDTVKSSPVSPDMKLDFMVHQYSRAEGLKELVNLLGEKAEKDFCRPIDPMKEVCVFNGASEALACVLQGILNEGDEVVFFEPGYDLFSAIVKMTGAIIKGVPLRPDLTLDQTQTNPEISIFNVNWDEFEAAFNNKTRVFLLNSPHNPTGKVFSKDEMLRIARVLEKFPDCILISDDVYENLIFDSLVHYRIPQLVPSLWDRSITVWSMGKTFSITGWKIGWAVGPAPLIKNAMLNHQWTVFCVSTPFQYALASALKIANQPYKGKNNYYEWIKAEYQRKREIFCKALTEAGFTPFISRGTFFILADASRIELPEPYRSDTSVTKDWSMCRWLTKEIGVTAIPPSAFCSEENKPLVKNYVRFTFCKTDQIMKEAGERLMKVKQFWKK